MSKTPNSSGSRHGEEHDWDSSEYVAKWAAGQDPKEVQRQEPFRLMADTLPYDKKLPIRILDVGAGYGGLTQVLLESFPNATAVCQDGSEEMEKLGHERMARHRGRFEYALSDFSKRGWSRNLRGPFDAAVSSIAIHNVRSPEIIHAIYDEILPLVKTGGCFLNFDRTNQPLEDQMRWLSEAGFTNVQCFWREEKRALFGGFRK